MKTKAYPTAGAIAFMLFLTAACNPFEFLYPPAPPSLLDERDQQSYKIIEIGDQYWMAENLNYAADSSWCYQNNPTMCQIYGRLYTNEAAQNACPDGWHLPSEAEFIAMEKALALDNEDLDYGVTPEYRGLTVGGQLKLDGTEFWKSPNTGATNASEFAALPAGYRYSDRTFHALTEETWFWTSSEKDPLQFVVHYLVYDQSGVGYKPKIFGSYGLSVRCVRD